VNVTLTRKLKLRQSLPRISAILLALMLFAVLFNVIVLISSSMSDRHAPQAHMGEISFTDINFVESPSLPLAGNWSFYWDRLLSPSDIVEQSHEVDYMNVSHSWENGTVDGVALPSHGHATYHVSVKLAHAQPKLALSIPSLGSAYVLYVNDKLYASGGTVSANSNESIAQYNPQIILFEPESDTFTLTLQVSNHQNFWGGLWKPLRIGAVETVYQEQFRLFIRYVFLVAVFLTVAMFNLTQFSLRPSDPLPFAIAITCLMLALRELGASQILHFAGVASWKFNTLERVNFLTFYGTIPVMVAYFHISFPAEFNKKIMSLAYAVSGVFCLLVLLTPPVVFSTSIHWYQGFAVALMPYLVWGLMQAVRNHRHGARLVMLGALFIFALTLNDILYSLGVIATTRLVSFGLVAFIMCLNYLTYIRFINAGHENEVLSGALAQSNKELKAFSSSLEEQIAQRTSELELANRKLEDMASHDPLTGLINRRGISTFVEQLVQQHQRSKFPLCVVMVDLDHFKIINDTYGHDVGDQVLIKCAKIMKVTLRAQDMVARWGGEEFMVILPQTNVEGASEAVKKIGAALKTSKFESVTQKITATFGIAQFIDGESFEECLKRADQALFDGKRNGRDRIEVAS
jgi:diguanylate cyclase (GGDEF)-like protein